ncbi:MAG: GLPGLI family protein [Bacteroidales bacterium]|nr:GLPGLI family protein [Bacteroidales bacterium]
MIKQIIFSAFMLHFSVASFAQQSYSGSVIYEETTRLEIKIDGEMAAMIKDLPTEKKSEKILWFSPQASLYDSYTKEGESVADGGAWVSEGNMKMVFTEPVNKVFVDLEKKEMIEQREFMTRLFLVTGDLPDKEWKITGEQEKILDYPCIKATNTDTSGLVTRVWFTPSINIPAGPGQLCNLPGLVLKVDIDEGKRILEARSISFDDPGKEVFIKPSKGKKVTREEFDTIVEEKMKEMGVETGASGSGTVVIKIRK